MMFRTLLSPVDGSPSSESALPWALNIAVRTGATLHIALVHVPVSFDESSSARWEDYDEQSRKQEAKYLAQLEAQLSDISKARVEIHHLEGLVPETLTAEATERNIDLVVMNAHGWGYIARAITGSVSDYLMRHLQIPLLVVHAAPNTPPVMARQMGLRRVLVPLDGTQGAERILPAARALGELWQAEFRLLRVVSPPRWSANPMNDEQNVVSRESVSAIQDKARTYLEEVAGQMRCESLKVESHVTVDHSPANAVLTDARSAACDLIAISTRGRGGLPRLLHGSVADKVIRGAETPVLVCKT